MRERKYFRPAAGLKIIDPLNRKKVPEGGKWVDVNDYWHRRVADGGGKLLDAAPEEAKAAEPPRAALEAPAVPEVPVTE